MIDPDWPQNGNAPVYAYGVYMYTRGTKAGRIWQAATGKGWPYAERNCYIGNAALLPNGNIMTAAWDKAGNNDRKHIVGTVDDIRRDFDAIANALDLSEEECQDMFQLVRRWVSHDYLSEEGESVLMKKFEYVTKHNRESETQ